MRREIDLRPMVVVFLGLAIGASSYLNPWLLGLCLPIVAFVQRWPIRVVAVASVALGFMLFPRLESTPVVESSFFEGELRVLTMPVTMGDRMGCLVQVEDRRYELSLPASSGAVVGDRLAVRADIRPLREGQVGRRGAIGRMYAISRPTVLSHGFFLWKAGLWVRQSFLDMTDHFAYRETAPLLDGLCFSMTSDIPVKFRQSMSRTGTSHVVSTSGLHVVLATFALSFVVGGIPLPRWGQVLLTLLLLGVYAAAAGMQPPVVRAVLMMAVFFLAYLVRRGTDGLSALGFAGSLSLLFAPELVQDIGFQLSMVAVGSLILFARLPDEDDVGFRELALRYFQSSFVVTLATAPLLAYHFGLVPLMSIPANLLVVPVLGLVISGALLSWILTLVFPAVGVGLLKISVEPMTGWIGLVIERFGSLPFASFAVPEFSAYWLLPIYLAAMALWRPHVRPA